MPEPVVTWPRPPSRADAPPGTRDIVVIDWPRTVWVSPIVWISAILLLSGFFLLAIDAGGVTGLTWRLVGAFSLMLLAVICVTIDFSAHMSRQQELQRVFDEATLAVARSEPESEFDWQRIEGAPSREEMVAAILATRYTETVLPPASARPVQMLLNDLRALRIRRPDVIVDRRVNERLNAVPATANLLEPEAVTSRWESSTLILDVIVILAALAIFWRLDDSTLRFLLPVWMLAPVAARRFSMMRLFLRHGIRPGDSGRIAGVGYLERPDGSRVGSSQALTLLSKRWNQPLYVRIVTPDQFDDLHFSSCKDPGFIAFWQRWNHPHPRPELLGESEARL